MNRLVVSRFLLGASLFLLPQTAVAQVEMAWSPVGNPGNAPDDVYGSLFGAVPYSYEIGTYDVTVSQYTAFLNAVAAADPYNLYAPGMGTDAKIAGIARSGSSGSYKYSVIGNSGNLPIAETNWGDAARFANWLQNGQPQKAEGPGTTETGAYTLNGALTADALTLVTRNAGATIFIPTEDEWFKAAYYNPATSSYYQYPFSSNTVPTSAKPGSTPNTGNFQDSNLAYALTGSTVLNNSVRYLTPVGAYTGSASPYGAYDMGGELFQWTEAINGNARFLRGGAWDDPVQSLSSDFRPSVQAGSENYAIGFRVASYPYPSLPGDVNLDGIVNGQDVAEVASHWLNTGFATTGDANHDGIVNGQDIALIAADWLQATGGGAGGGANVPEPGGIVLALTGFAGMLIDRRHRTR